MSNSPVPDLPRHHSFESLEPQFFEPQFLLPRRLRRPGYPSSCCHPYEGMAERRQARIPCSRAALVRARRAPCDRCARLSALRRDGFGPGKPRAPVPALLAAGALIEPRRRHPTSRTAVCRDATPAPSSGSSPETPLIERDARLIRRMPAVVNIFLHFVVEKSWTGASTLTSGLAIRHLVGGPPFVTIRTLESLRWCHDSGNPSNLFQLTESSSGTKNATPRDQSVRGNRPVVKDRSLTTASTAGVSYSEG
jgi:hypothetical protein